jgi:hypothetical protein
MEIAALQMESRPYRAMLVALGLYVLCSPLSTYNTLAMFGLVESRLVPLQVSITAVMICFAMIAGSAMGRHCSAIEVGAKRRLWIAAFWVIGPPALYAFYHLRLKRHYVPMTSVIAATNS